MYPLNPWGPLDSMDPLNPLNPLKPLPPLPPPLLPQYVLSNCSFQNGGGSFLLCRIVPFACRHFEMNNCGSPSVVRRYIFFF